MSIDRNQQARVIDAPEPCFVRMQLVRNGVFVAARIFHRLGILTAEINGQITDDVYRVWHAGTLIDEDEYNRMMSNPEPNPYRVVHISHAGLAERVREAEENDFWWWRNFA